MDKVKVILEDKSGKVVGGFVASDPIFWISDYAELITPMPNYTHKSVPVNNQCPGVVIQMVTITSHFESDEDALQAIIEAAESHRKWLTGEGGDNGKMDE